MLITVLTLIKPISDPCPGPIRIKHFHYTDWDGLNNFVLIGSKSFPTKNKHIQILFLFAAIAQVCTLDLFDST